MKYFKLQILLAASMSLLAMQVFAAKTEYKSEKDRFSYAIGYQIGNQLKQQGISDKIDAKVLNQAIKDVFAGSEPKVSLADMQAAIQAAQKKLLDELKAKAEKKKKEGDDFRAKNKARKGVTELPNGIQYEVLKDAKGETPKATDTVTVHYHGTLIDGKVFDSSVKRGQPATFPLNGVIKGWQEILPMIPTGAKWKVVIPPELAYGMRGQGSIGPNETLIFEIELLSIKK